MSALGTLEQALSLAAKRFSFWDAESRARSLDDWESKELERAWRQMQRDEGRFVRAQAAPPPARSRRGKR
jgi:hypothetical protein